jgi:hypothetical protein
MKKGGRCLTILAFMLLGGLLTVFIVGIVATQFIAGAQKDVQATLAPVQSLVAATSQALATKVQPTATLVESTAADIGVTIDAPVQPSAAQPPAGVQPGASDAAPSSGGQATATPAITATASPTLGEIGLGTPSFPLTLTVQHAQDQTRVAGYLNSINATATEDSRQSQIIFATLTAAAQSKRK